MFPRALLRSSREVLMRVISQVGVLLFPWLSTNVWRKLPYLNVLLYHILSNNTLQLK